MPSLPASGEMKIPQLQQSMDPSHLLIPYEQRKLGFFDGYLIGQVTMTTFSAHAAFARNAGRRRDGEPTAMHAMSPSASHMISAALG